MHSRITLSLLVTVLVILFSTAASAQQIGIIGNGSYISDNDTTPSTADGTDFAGNTSRTFTLDNIQNSGNTKLDVTSIVLSNTSQFSITSDPTPVKIKKTALENFTIAYTGSGCGTFTSTVTVTSSNASNDGGDNAWVFTISAGVDSEIDLFGNGVEITNGDTAPSTVDDTDFGSANTGDTIIKTYTITNNGGCDLNLTGGASLITLTNAVDFTVDFSSTATTIAPGASTTFTIAFSPLSGGSLSSIVAIANDDADENPYTFTIQGFGVVVINPLYTVYNANFDASDESWTASNPGGNSVWTYGENLVEEATDGLYWYTNNYDNYAANSDTYVTSPTINLSGYNDLRLYIDIRHSLCEDTDDGMYVEYSANGGTTWSLLGSGAEPVDNQWYNETSVGALGGVAGWSCDNDATAAAGKSQFSQSSVDLPVALYNNPLARLRVRFASDSDSDVDDGANFDNVIIVGNPLVAPSDPVSGPGSVNSNLRVWLKADEGIAASNGTAITTWDDNAIDNDAKVASYNAPIYFNNATENINHNPVLTFNETDQTTLKGEGGFFTHDYWVVMKADGTVDGTTASEYEGIVAGRAASKQFAEDATGLWTGNISLRFDGEDNMISHMVGTTPGSVDADTKNSYGRAYESSTDTYTDEVIILNIKSNTAGTATEIYKNGIRIDNVSGKGSASPFDTLPFEEVKNSPFVIGTSYANLNRTDINSWFNGKLTEFISFSDSNSTSDQKKIQSYLALKNGVTLHNTTSTTATRLGDENYIDSDGTTIWNVATHNGYNYDIAGIGTDTAAGLNQKQSTTSNVGATVTMGLTDVYETNSENVTTNTDVIADKNFLMWGNDNGTFAAAAPINVDLSAGTAGLSTSVDFIAITRSWKVVETGSVGTVKVSVPTAALTATITPPGDFLMFISDTPSFSPSSEYRVMSVDGTNLEASYNFNGTKYITFGYAPEYIYERSITFNGATDYLEVSDDLDFTSAFSVSAWVKHTGNDYTVLSKRDAAFTEGYDLSIDSNNKVNMSWINSSGTQTIISDTSVPNNEWHQIAVSYDGATASVYIDGYLDKSAPLSAPEGTDKYFMIAAADEEATTSFYQGTMDEVRAWDAALSADQIRYIMNQEIEEHSDFTVNGKIVPQTVSKNEFESTLWANLKGYFPMNRYTFTNIKDESDSHLVAAIKNLQTVDFQTAPLPYISVANGNWNNTNTWANGTTQELPGAASLVDASKTIDWNIVQTSHNVTTNANNTVLSLEVNAAELSIENDSKIEVSHYFKLDGILDLVGESQLIQTENSDLDVTSIGRLERDQQGTADTYSYNLWSSPVGRVSITDINVDFAVSSIMNDGTNVNSPASMNFSGDYNGAATTPITISAYWLYTYRNNAADDYSAWEYLGPYGNIAPGDGYTMKGAGTGGILDPQNYTFIGKPNNSTTTIPIEKTITAGNESLIGNPFPSALNADLFIAQNPHLTGTLSFWEHWGGGSHYLEDYQAGYALYNLSGGTPAVSHPDIDQTGSGTKTPTPFVAVGQGFFVKATSDGTTTFNNSQRVFAKQDTSSTFFFNSGEDETEEDTSNIEDEIVLREDTREKFRIGFDSPSQFHRQLLMTIDNNTTFGYDRAYDGIIENHPQEDMTWMLEDQMAIIQGVPAIENERQFPVRVTLPMDGEVSIGIDAFENVDTENVKVYVFDTLLNSYTEINLEYKYTLNLAAGTYADRFYIVFKRKEQSEDTQEEEETSDAEETQETEENTQSVEVVEVQTVLDETIAPEDLTVLFDSQSSSISITKRLDYEIKSVQLFTILGQLIKEWTPESDTTEIQLPVGDVSTGAYILNIQKLQTTYTQKLIIH